MIDQVLVVLECIMFQNDEWPKGEPHVVFIKEVFKNQYHRPNCSLPIKDTCKKQGLKGCALMLPTIVPFYPKYAKSPLNKDFYTVKVQGYQQNYFNFIQDWIL